MYPTDRKADTGSLLKSAAILYGLMAALALVWNALRGREILLFSETNLYAAVGVGVLTGLLTFGLGFAAYVFLPAMRRITEEMAALIASGTGSLSLDIFSLLSGIGEEMLFRGTIQAEFGLIAASIVFGLLHIGPSPRYLVWTAWAIGGGFLYGGLYELTGGILAPAVAHVLHNALTLLYWKAKIRSETSEETS